MQLEANKKREQRNNSLNISTVGQHLMVPNTVQQPSTQKLFNKMGQKPSMHQYGAGSGQNVFTHVGQNTLKSNVTTFSMSGGSTQPDKSGPPRNDM